MGGKIKPIKQAIFVENRWSIRYSRRSRLAASLALGEKMRRGPLPCSLQSEAG